MMIRHLFGALLGAVVLTGCDAGPSGEGTGLNALQGKDFRNDPRAAARVERLAQADAPSILFKIVDRDVLGALYLTQRRGTRSIWLSPDNSMVVLDRGVITATRGLGWDLMSAEVEATAQLIQNAREGRARRVHRHLDGEDRLIARSFFCEITTRGTRQITYGGRDVTTHLMEENCAHGDQKFRNLYWVQSGSGTVLQSRQWAGDGLGNLAIRHVQ